MRKIVLFTAFIALFTACSSDREYSYGDHELIITGDLETPFKSEGETRRISVSVRKQKYTFDHAMDVWTTVAPYEVRMYNYQLGDQFEITDQTITGNTLSFNLTAKENLWALTPQIGLEFFVKEDNGIFSVQSPSPIQEEVKISYEYRIGSEAPDEIIFPPEGGVEIIDFILECRITTNGKQSDWFYPDLELTGLRYAYQCFKGASHHSLAVEPGEGYGHYQLRITARPYYLESESDQLLWAYTIWVPELHSNDPQSGRLFQRQFIHEQDRSLVGVEGALASGDQYVTGPMKLTAE